MLELGNTLTRDPDIYWASRIPRDPNFFLCCFTYGDELNAINFIR